MLKSRRNSSELDESEQEVSIHLLTLENGSSDKALITEASNNRFEPSTRSIVNENIEILIPDVQTTDTKANNRLDHDTKISQSSSTSSVVSNSIRYEEQLQRTFVLVWLNYKMDLSHDALRNYVTQLRFIISDVRTFNDFAQCTNFINGITGANVLMVVPANNCEDIIPAVHEMLQIDSIYVFSRNSTPCEPFANRWSKIKGVFSDVDDLLRSIRKVTELFENDSVSISVTSTDTTSKENLDELDASFMYTQLLKEILLEIHYDKQSVNDFVAYCRQLYAKDSKALKIINKFEQEYCPEKALWWYTCESFLYRMLNKALRDLEINNLIKLGFFIHDLHRQLEVVNQEQYDHSKVKCITVYRGQSVCEADFEKIVKTPNGLISFNNFLSTSADEKVSTTFGKNAGRKPGFVGILFEMAIDTSIKSSPFAALDKYSFYEDEEKEILFSTHTVFRIKEIKPIDIGNLRWRITLTLTNDNDSQLKAVTQCIRTETEGLTGWHRLGILLVKVGEYFKAEDVYQVLLKQTGLDEVQKAYLFHQLGWTKRKQGSYEKALEYYENAKTIREKVLPEYHVDLVSSNNHIGDVYKSMGDYLKALSHYERALEICKNTTPVNNLQLAICNNNIGDLYNDMTEYSNARVYYKTALELREQILPPAHPDLATSNNNIGDAYNNLGEYSEALPYYKKALYISQLSLPSNHPDFATFYNNLGSMYDNIGEYLQALSYYERALENSKISLPEDHPNLIDFYNNIGLVYFNLGSFTKALAYYEDALRISKKSFPEDHPNLATCYNNIGLVYLKLGDYSQALSYYQKDLEISSKSLPSNHLDLGATYNSLGHVYFHMGEFSKALINFEQALKICEKGLPSNHPSLAKCHHNIGNVYSHSKEYSKALLYFETALKMRESSIPRNLPDLAASYNSIGLLYSRMNEHTKAVFYSEQAVEYANRSLPEDNLEVKMYEANAQAIKNCYRLSSMN